MNQNSNHFQQKIIYDIGANIGDDITYYLKKADIVIAVEANPLLCAEIENKFSEQIENEKLIVVNCVLTSDSIEEEVFFYIHKYYHVLSQFPKPAESEIENFEKVLLPSKSVLELINKYGVPYYIKIDIEHYDAEILKALFRNNIRPPFISAEAHSIEIFALLLIFGEYDAFKLIECGTIPIKYKNHLISILGDNKKEVYSFPYDSAGPFGEDVHGEWMTANNFFRLLAIENSGWIDIHATNLISPNPHVKPKIVSYINKEIKRSIIEMIRPLIPPDSNFRRILKKLFFRL